LRPDLHPYFVATQAHPELRSRPTRAHPLFAGLVEAALIRQREMLLPVGDVQLAYAGESRLGTRVADADDEAGDSAALDGPRAGGATADGAPVDGAAGDAGHGARERRGVAASVGWVQAGARR
jgi:CTP synthase